jgi:stage II sporulation protein D
MVYNSISKPIRFFIYILLSMFCFTILISVFMIGINSDKPTKPVKDSIISKSSEQHTTIRVFITKENKVVELDLEDYVKGVVSGEMPESFELEALKAQSIAARTYALAKIEHLGGKPCGLHPDADICDTVHCQVYKNKENNLSSKIEQAVNSTKGEVLNYGGKPITSPLFFSSSGGRTEDSAQVFSSALPYLKGVDSPGEDKEPRITTVNIPITDFVNKINKEYTDSKLSASQVKKQIQILKNNSGGTVDDIKLGKETIKGRKFRELFNLKSANFKLNFSEKSVEITCIGSGHGVGMSQYGANNMAKAGSNYKDILTHYYQGTEVSKIK